MCGSMKLNKISSGLLREIIPSQFVSSPGQDVVPSLWRCRSPIGSRKTHPEKEKKRRSTDVIEHRQWMCRKVVFCPREIGEGGTRRRNGLIGNEPHQVSASVLGGVLVAVRNSNSQHAYERIKGHSGWRIQDSLPARCLTYTYTPQGLNTTRSSLHSGQKHFQTNMAFSNCVCAPNNQHTQKGPIVIGFLW